MKLFDTPLGRIASFTEANRLIRSGDGPVQLTGCVESQKVHMMIRAGDSVPRLIVTYDETEARRLFEDCGQFSKNVLLFPAKDLLFYQADVKSSAIAADRMKVIRALFENQEDLTVVTSIAAMMNTLAPPEQFAEQLITLSEGSTCEIPAVSIRLTELGYERCAKAESPGQFAVHGGILDIYDLTAENPYRIEFWGDEIDTIRTYNAETQLSADRLESVTVYPASELFLTARELGDGRDRIRKDYRKNLEKLKARDDLEAGASLQHLMQETEDAIDEKDLRGSLERMMPYFFDRLSNLMEYLPPKSVVCLDEPERMREYGLPAETEFNESIFMRLEKGLALPLQGKLMRSVKETFASMETGRTICFTGLDTKLAMMKIRGNFRIDCQSVVSYQGNFEGLISDLRRYLDLKFGVILTVPSRTRAGRLADELREMGLRALFTEDAEREAEDGMIFVVPGNLHRGYLYPQQKFVVLTEGDIYGGVRKKKRKKQQEYDGEKILNFAELSVGDYVVHENYGIGVYRGIENIVTDDVARDYLKISYGDSGTLYIPVTNLDVVQKYASADAKPPRLSRLDSPEWKRTRLRVKAAVEEVAEELVQLYALRQTGKGYKYGPDTVWQTEFEELFPFEETQDQLDAIEAVKRDMEEGKIMDRLLCGDVGFGKTEVALRAAFKAALEGKQVAYLVPTTILAGQHYNTFVQRMANYPVVVEMMSRFKSAEQQKKTVENLKSGMTDIVIGTHRILSKDVQFKNLGLLIIDEEQRFGVGHKEKIKQMKTNVDVLTLTATPIPRTLHMSMIGVRDMSVLSEPPTDRMAIQTYVMEYSDELAREAILREISRGGQVYYVHNRVQDIEEVTAAVQALVPDAVVSYAHGKMSERELEKRMLAFIEGEIDVLVSTTIIETGLDIPNVNTIIVHDAERYGLSQLYQLRGRVGRSNRQAYAFIMYRKNSIPGENAQKRLEAIRQFTELGSGIKIAKQDLEIRGAGAVLGNAQSGHMTLVGYDLYCKMLSQAVKKAKGETEDTEPFDTLLDIKTDAYVPGTYINDEKLKLEAYKRISYITNEEDKEELIEELTDRYGDVPQPCLNLMEVSLLRAYARSLYLSEIKGNLMELKFRFVPFAKVKAENIPVLIEKMQGAMRFLPGEAPGLLWHRLNILEADKDDILTLVKKLLSEIKQLLI